MSECGCHVEATTDPGQRRALWIALALNALMAVVGSILGWIAQSTGVLADALDMLADAAAYAIGLAAIGRSLRFKQRAAYWSGGILLLLGLGLLIETGRRGLVGSEPVGGLMLLAAGISLVVNLIVLRLLQRFKQSEVHLRATWIFTRADVVANLGVLVAAGLVAITGSRFPDLLVGGAIGAYVVKEAIEILREAREERPRHASSKSNG